MQARFQAKLRQQLAGLCPAVAIALAAQQRRQLHVLQRI